MTDTNKNSNDKSKPDNTTRFGQDLIDAYNKESKTKWFISYEDVLKAFGGDDASIECHLQAQMGFAKGWEAAHRRCAEHLKNQMGCEYDCNLDYANELLALIIQPTKE